MVIRTLLILLLIFRWRILAVEYTSRRAVQDVEISLSNNIIIAASNSEKSYILYLISNNIKNTSYVISYPNDVDHVHTLAALTMKDKDNISFLQIVEDGISNVTKLSRVNMRLTNIQLGDVLWDKIVPIANLSKTDQGRFLLKVDPREEYAYVFGDPFMLSYNLLTKEKKPVPGNKLTACDGKKELFIPYAFDVTDEWAAVAGFHQIEHHSQRMLQPHLCIFNLSSLCCINTTAIGSNTVKNSGISSNTRDFDMSVSINPSGTIVAIGQGSFDAVIIAVINGTNTSKFISEMYEIAEDEQSIGFGHSVAWLDDNGTLAILVGKSGSRHLLESEIQVYTHILPNTNSGPIVPSFTLPNSQQALHKVKQSRGWNKHTFLTIRARSNNLLILRDDAKLVYMQSSDPGLCPMEPLLISQTRLNWRTRSRIAHLQRNISQNQFNESFLNLYVLQPQPCVSGTYKNVSGFGPCTICPPGKKNPGRDQLMECQNCRTGWFCPLGATDDINITHFRSHNQTFNYPDSPTIDNYDDLLLLNFIPNNVEFYCVFSSPLPWVVLCIILGFIIWIIMLLIKKRQSTTFGIHRKRMKLVFKQIDLISEGERFVGGLASIVVFAVIVYSIVYGIIYFHSYSIEDGKGIRASCDDQQQNTKFDNALQLPLPEPEGYYWEIFHMLDRQKFRMIVDLINTRAQCDKISIQHNKHRGKPETITGIQCQSTSNSSVTQFSFDIPTHTSTVQVNIEGPYFIGALRLCLRGLSNTTIYEGKNFTQHELDACTLFYTDNQTIGLSTDFNVYLIKVINVTNPLRRYEKPKYDGRWAPIIKYVDDLSEELYYAKTGEYLRYAADQTTFTVAFNEENYFVQNNKSPIIRRAAITFHTFMFIFLFMDTIGIIFVLYKLWGRPLLQRLLQPCHVTLEHEVQASHPEMTIDSSSQPQLAAESIFAETSENFGQNLAVKTNQDIHRRHHTKSDVKTPGASSALPTALSSNQLAIDHSHEDFNKRLNIYAEQIERLSNDVIVTKNQNNELKREVMHLKQCLANTGPN